MEYPTYLIHYGIPGQKWGERRWQYEDGSLTPEGYIHYGYGKRESTKQKIEYLGIRDRIKSGKATKNDLSKLSGSTYISDLDSMYVSYGYKFVDDNRSAIGTKRMDEIYEFGGREKISSGVDVGKVMVNPAMTLKKNQPLNLDDDLVMKSVTRRINPNYGEKGTNNNCVRCSTAMSLAKMGYSTPQGLTAGRSMCGADANGFSYWFNGAKTKTGNYDDIFDELNKQPKGSFGAVGISRYDANGNRIGGHSMTYSILSDGSVRVEDSQCNKTFDSLKAAMENCSASNSGLTFTRLDNTTPNLKALANDSMVDVGGNRTKTPVYMIRDQGSFSYNNSNNRVTRYNFENSGTLVDYSTAGRRNDDTLGGSDTSNIIFDDEGRMYYRGR